MKVDGKGQRDWCFGSVPGAPTFVYVRPTAK